jgi:plastocyanin
VTLLNLPLPLLSLGCVFGPGHDDAFTMFKAGKISTRRLKPEVRDNLLFVRSNECEPGEAPSAWQFSFKDRTCLNGVRSVIVNQHGSSETPAVLASFTTNKADFARLQPIVRKQLEVDSPKIVSEMAKLSVRTGTTFEYCLYRDGKHNVWCMVMYHDGVCQHTYYRDARNGLIFANGIVHGRLVTVGGLIHHIKNGKVESISVRKS